MSAPLSDEEKRRQISVRGVAALEGVDDLKSGKQYTVRFQMLLRFLGDFLNRNVCLSTTYVLDFWYGESHDIFHTTKI